MATVTRARARWSSESGAELIEFALVFPLLLFVVLGIIDFGFLFQRYEVVTNAAREGARVGVLYGYADEDVEPRVTQYLTAAGLTGTPTVVISHPAVDILGHCIDTTRVNVTYPHTYSFVGGIAGYFGASGFTAATLSATSQMRTELPASCP